MTAVARRDARCGISHELRTPLGAVAGYTQAEPVGGAAASVSRGCGVPENQRPCERRTARQHTAFDVNLSS